MATAFADGLDMKCQRKESGMILKQLEKMQLPLTKSHKKSVGREGSLQEEESAVFNVSSLR